MPIPEQFPTSRHEVSFHGVSLAIETLGRFDDVLDYYAKHHPDDVDLIPYYAHLWDSAMGLCDFLAGHGDWIRGKRILELGCGLALPSLLCAKLGAQAVLATDFHPDVGAFVTRNIANCQLGEKLTYAPFDWKGKTKALPQGWRTPDLILASDVLYEAEAVQPFAECAARLCQSGGTLLVADPGRTRLEAAIHALRELGLDSRLHIHRDIFVLEFTVAKASACGSAR